MEDLANGLMGVKIMIKRTRMRLEVVARTRGEITQIVSITRTIEIREEEEEGKELGEEASMENVHYNEEGHQSFECPQHQGRNDKRNEW